MSAAVSILRLSSLPEGSPTLVVPPPISTIGLWPVFWSRRSIMIDSRLADMQAIRRGVEAHIAGDHARAHGLFETLDVGALVQESAFLHHLDKFEPIAPAFRAFVIIPFLSY